MNFNDYSQLAGVNWSTLSAIRISPKHYQHRLRTPRADTPGMRLGRAIHCATLEPDVFPLLWTVYDGRRAGAAWTEFATVNADKSVLTVEEYATVLSIRDAVHAHKAARRLLRHGRPEVTLQWVDPATRIKCKARLDHLRGGALTDLKSTRDIDSRVFGRLATSMGYVEQLAFYRSGLDALGIAPGPVRIVAVESQAPFDVAVYRIGEDELYAAGQVVGELLARVKDCRRKRRWPGRYETELPLQVPPWYFNDDDSELELLGLKPKEA